MRNLTCNLLPPFAIAFMLLLVVSIFSFQTESVMKSAVSQCSVSAALDSVGAIYNIKYGMPEDFYELDKVQSWTPVYTDGRFGWLYWEFESKDNECKVLYRLLPSDIEIGHRVDSALKNIYGTEDDAKNKYLRVFPLKKARESFNADSVFLYEVPTAQPARWDAKYTYCTQMLIYKVGRPNIELVWYFTEKGKKKEKRYMRKVDKRIWFNEGEGRYSGQVTRGEDWLRSYLKKHDISWGDYK